MRIGPQNHPSIPPRSEVSADRPLKVTSLALQHIAFISISIGSAYFLGQNFSGRCILLSLSLATFGKICFDIFHFSQSSEEEIKEKADQVAHALLRKALVATALITGAVGGFFLKSIFFLSSGTYLGGPLLMLRGISDVSFLLGFTPLFSKILLKYFAALRFSHLINSKTIQILQNTISPEQPPIQNTLKILDTLQPFFLHFFYVLGIKEKVFKIKRQIPEIRRQIKALENRSEDPKTLQHEAEQIFHNLNRIVYRLAPIREALSDRISNNLQQLPDLQEQGSPSQKLLDEIDLLLEDLTSKDPSSLESRLQPFFNASTQEEEQEGKDLAYEVLGAWFRIGDFRNLGLRLNLSTEQLNQREIQRTSEYLEDHGLSTRSDLIKNKILTPPEEGALTTEIITERIVAFYSSQRSAARTITNIFCRTLLISAKAIQAFEQYKPILAGLVWRVYYNDRANDLELICQKISKQLKKFLTPMQVLYLQIWRIRASVEIGVFGGFLSGILLAHTNIHYGRNLPRRFRQQRRVEPQPQQEV